MARAATSNGDGRQAQRRREEVLQTAAEMFLANGYDATSTRDIAERLGMLKGSLYYYVDSKDDLLYEVIKDVYDRGEARLQAVLDGPGTPLEKLRLLIEGHLVNLTENLTATALLLHEHRRLSAERRRLVDEKQAEYRDAVVNLIAQGQRDGLVREDVDPDVATFVLLGALNWTYRWYRPDGEKDAAEVARQFAEVLLSGLAKDPAGSRAATGGGRRRSRPGAQNAR